MNKTATSTDRVDILGVRVSVTTPEAAIAEVGRWIDAGAKEYVCVADVNALLHAAREPALRDFYNASGLTLADGMPLVWASRAAGAREAVRVSGPDFFPAVVEASVAHGYRHYLLGGDEDLGRRLTAKLQERYRGVRIVGSFSPPFRQMTPTEEAEMVSRVNAARPDVVWVALGAPKQEQWMAQFRDRLDASVLVGVGAAFAFVVGDVQRAPAWMQRRGLEWLYRLTKEPMRLWRRYTVAVPTFLVRVLTHPPRRVPASLPQPDGASRLAS